MENGKRPMATSSMARRFRLLSKKMLSGSPHGTGYTALRRTGWFARGSKASRLDSCDSLADGSSRAVLAGFGSAETGDWKTVAGQFSRSVTDIAAVGDTLWIATQRGFFELRIGKSRLVFSPAILPAARYARWR